jgi:hypothetical protein
VTLTYIDGWAAVPPLRDDMLTDEALASVAALLRRYHQAVASFRPTTTTTTCSWASGPEMARGIRKS